VSITNAGVTTVEQIQNVPITAPTAGDDGYVIFYNHTGGTFSYMAMSTAMGISAVVDDTSPELGGDLTLNGHSLIMPTTTIGDCIVDTTLSAASNSTLASSYAIKEYADTKVIAPATNTDGYVPVWTGANSKTLANGYVVGTAANSLVVLDGDAKLPAVDGSNLTGIATSAGNGYTEVTSLLTTTSSAYADISGLSKTLTTYGGNVLVIMSSNVVWLNGAHIVYFKSVLDGSTDSSESFAYDSGANEFAGMGHFTWLFTGVSASSHTFKIQWRTTGATAHLNTRNGSAAIGSTRIIVVEV
jgi:hypothetical protein